MWALTAARPAANDVKFCQQIREATRSARRNTAEGFGRYYPKEFVQFLRIAAGSLHEAKDCLHQAADVGYVSPLDYDRLLKLVVRAIKSNSSLIRYLLTANAPTPRPPGTPPRATTPKRQEPQEPGEPPEPREPEEPREPQEP